MIQYSLETLSPEFFSNQFKIDELIFFFPCKEHEVYDPDYPDQEYGFTTMRALNFEFEVFVEAKNSELDLEMKKQVLEVVERLVEFDTYNRTSTYNEILCFIVIKMNRVILNYGATTVNTSWRKCFERSIDGDWSYVGLW